ncbi:MAG: hypothetical protein WB755_02390, partial [Terriglobales bacterium]
MTANAKANWFLGLAGSMPLQVRAGVALPGSETLDFHDNSRTTRSFSPLLENHKHRGHDHHEPHQV